MSNFNFSDTLLKYHGALMGFAAGVGFALVFSLTFMLTNLEFISWAMLVGTPISVGAFTVFFASSEQTKSWLFNVFHPWYSVLGWMLLATIFAWETLICVVMLLPLYLPLASLGGYVAGVLRQKRFGNGSNGTLLSLGLLPLLIVPIEAPFQTPTLWHTEVDIVVINAPISQVWKSLENIENIQNQELKWTFSHFIGLPKPRSSTVAELEVGALRHLSWEKGIHFEERITQIIPEKLLAYDVLIDQQSMKIANLDTHVTVGDQYFDIVKGHYALEEIGNKTRLSVSTSYKMTTNLNWYGRFWANIVLDDFHGAVLNLIKNRNEAMAQPAANADNA
ncbi:MAG: hypothetical protein OCD03_05790 [Hyphomicrobiales bacterium]